MAVPLPLAAGNRIVLHINGLAAVTGKPGVTNHAKRLVERAFVQYCGGAASPHGQLPWELAYSLAALAIAGEMALVRSAAVATLLDGRRAGWRAFALFESTKSATRGTISARKREPLKTP
jgi:hypothetical protein